MMDEKYTPPVYELVYSEEYLSDIKKHAKSGQKIILSKIEELLCEIENTPLTGKGKVERLKGYDDKEVYSRRIDQKHRLVYEVFEKEKEIVVLSAYGHYDDK